MEPLWYKDQTQKMFQNAVAQNPSSGPAGGWQPASEAITSLAGYQNLVIKITKSSDSGVRLLGHTGQFRFVPLSCEQPCLSPLIYEMGTIMSHIAYSVELSELFV